MEAYPVGPEALASHGPENRRQHQETYHIAEKTKLKGMKTVAKSLDHDVGEREQNGAECYPDDTAHVARQGKPSARPFIREGAV